MQTQPSTVICRAGCRTRSPPESVRYRVLCIARRTWCRNRLRRRRTQKRFDFENSGFEVPGDLLHPSRILRAPLPRGQRPQPRRCRITVWLPRTHRRIYFVDEVQGVQPHRRQRPPVRTGEVLTTTRAAMTLDVYADLFDDDLEAVATALDAARARENAGTRPNEAPVTCNCGQIVGKKLARIGACPSVRCIDPF